MARIEWDKAGTRFYEAGVDRGVLYRQDNKGEYPKGVPWNGLTGITESPDGAEATDLWADNIKYATLRSAETYGGTIEAYTYPDEFATCDGSAIIAEGVKFGQQSRSAFGLCYRTLIGNDTMTDSDDGYLLHLVYGATASPSERAYETINDSPDAITFSWEFTTVPVAVDGYKAVSSVTINSLKADPEKLEELENILYGDGSNEAMLPLPSEIIEMFGSDLGA